jgi:uncharacterized protein with HEPN domain
MSRDSLLYLEDILQAAQKIIRYTIGFEFQQFCQDDRTYDAVIRNLEIIGEAARNIPDDFRQQFPQVEWRSIAAFRNILAHQYFAIRNEIVWDIVTQKIPLLHTLIQEVIKQSDTEGKS